MSRRRSRPRRGHDPGQLYTREERARAKMLVRDLQRQLDRCEDPARAVALVAQIDGIRREQAYDREVSARQRQPRGRR